MILALISAQRGQTLKALSLDIWLREENQFVFHFKTLLKTSRLIYYRFANTFLTFKLVKNMFLKKIMPKLERAKIKTLRKP